MNKVLVLLIHTVKCLLLLLVDCLVMWLEILTSI